MKKKDFYCKDRKKIINNKHLASTSIVSFLGGETIKIHGGIILVISDDFQY